MSDPVKIKPEELWGVWDCEYDEWMWDKYGMILVDSESVAKSYAEEESKKGNECFASPIVDLSGWVKKEDAQ